MMIGAAVLLLSSGCKGNLDQKLVDKLQASLKEHKESAENFKPIAEGYQSLDTKMNGLDENLKTGDAYTAAKTRISTMRTKTDATLSGYNDLIAKLDKLYGDYSGGKIKAEDVNKEYDVIMQGLGDHRLILEDRIRDLKMLNMTYVGIQTGHPFNPDMPSEDQEAKQAEHRRNAAQMGGTPGNPTPAAASKEIPRPANGERQLPPGYQGPPPPPRKQ